MRVRNHCFDRGSIKSYTVGVPVISIGNLTLGGTGKTPLVEWVARNFCERGVPVSIVSRGYGAGEGGLNDEARELRLALPDVPHLQSTNRVEAARQAIKEFGAELILLDDGFQHRRLRRNLDIVLLDATEPFGFEHVFPRGTLREPLTGLARADVVMLSRADMLESYARQVVRDRVARLAPQAVWCEVQHAPQELINASGDSTPLDTLRGKRIAAFCGIGNPAGFHHSVESLGVEVVAWREYPDHYSYSQDDIESLAQWADSAETILCTRKDLVKVQVATIGGIPLRSVGVQLQFSAGQSEFEAALGSV